MLATSLVLAACSGNPPSLIRGEQLTDAGQDATLPRQGAPLGCGLTEEQAEQQWPGERICPTIVYEPRSGYCRHFVRCDSF